MLVCYFKTGVREQINEITSFIDAGGVYGDSFKKWQELVDSKTGIYTNNTKMVKEKDKVRNIIWTTCQVGHNYPIEE